MTFNEFVDYMSENLMSKSSFYQKAMEFQEKKNKKRPPAKRWNKTKLDRAVNKMWEDILRNMYDRIKPSVDKKAYDQKEAWLDYMTTNNILDAMDDGLIEIEFEEN